MEKLPMNRLSINAALILVVSIRALAASAATSEALAQTPPMGWNSFDSYGVYLHEQAALANLEAMAEKLLPYGYEYFVIDNGWFGEYTLQEGTIFPAEKHAHDIRIDEYGYFLPSKVYFPNGLKPIVERCHDLGLKFGVHLMRGIPRKAYEMNLPIKGTRYTARDIADTNPDENCKWCHYCYAVDMSKPGAQEWYDGLIEHVASIGVDMIKYDDIVAHPDEVEAVAKAIDKTDRPILLSLSPGNTVDPDAIDFFRMSNMVRVTPDVWDEQKYIDLCFEAWRKWQGKEQPGFWIDMDMIPFGQLQLMSPPSSDGKKTVMDKGDIALAGKGVNRICQLSRDQMETFITIRAMAASPLMMGGDLPSLDMFSLSLITDVDMLACNQNGVMGSLIYAKDDIEVWKSEKKGSAQVAWVAIFNRSEVVKPIVLSAAKLGLKEISSIRLRNIWKKAKLDLNELVKIPINGVIFIAVNQ